MPKKLWTDERIHAELEKCEQWADVCAVVFGMRDEYEARIAELLDAMDKLGSGMIRISLKMERDFHARIAELELRQAQLTQKIIDQAGDIKFLQGDLKNVYKVE